MPNPLARKRVSLLFIIFNLFVFAALFFIVRQVAFLKEKTLEKPLPVYGVLRPFKLTEKSGEEFSLENMKDKVWVANFMFTHCPNECPTMNFKVSLLQDSLAKDVGFVSISVDPTKDTPSILSGYAKKLNAREGVWFFLTGAKLTIGQILEDCHFAKADDPLLHGLRLVLLDKKSRVRGYYDYTDEFLVKKLTRDIRLLKERG